MVAKVGAMAVLACGAAWGQETAVERIGSFFDALNRGLAYMGERSEGLIVPRLGPLSEYQVDPFSGLSKVTRDVERSYPCRPDAAISIANEFGAVHVTTWDNPLVQLQATISVGAKEPSEANRILEEIDPAASVSPENIEIRTRLPETRNRGAVVIEVNYLLKTPRTARISCANAFGDTTLHDLNAPVALDSWYGAVDLQNIGGPVTARAQGEFPFTARLLRQGGVFTLRDAHAEFSGVSGALTVANFRGSLTLRDMGAETTVEATSQSGPLHAYLSEQTTADIVASALFGDVQSDMPMDKTMQGNAVLARCANADAKQRFRFHVFFETAYLHLDGGLPPSNSGPVPALGGAALFDRVIELSSVVADGAPLSLKTIQGNVRVEGADTDRLTVRARPVAHMEANGNVRAALEALTATLTPREDGIHVTTEVRDDMASLGCRHYSVDVTVQCPRTARLSVVAQSGRTSVAGLGGPVAIEQTEGAVTAESVKGELVIVNRKGDIDILDCAGPVTAQTSQGALGTRMVYGRQTLRCEQGSIIVDAPQGEVWARQRGGDVRVLAIDGIRGDCDIGVEQGNLRLLAGPSSDAAFVITARNGEVRPRALSLQGSILEDTRRFQGKMNNGRYAITLFTQDGDVFID